MAEKRWKRKQIRLQDFEKNIHGEYEYRGAMYRFSGNYRTFMIKAWALVLAIVALVITAGILPATGAMDTWYVVIPFAVTIGAAGFCCYRLVQWSSGNGLIREYNYEKTVTSFPKTIKVLIGAAGVTLFTEGTHLILNGMGEYPTGAVVLLVSMAIIIVLGILLERLVSLISWEKQGV